MSEENTVILGNTATTPEGADYIVAVSQKASTAYVKQVAANLDAKKVDKSAYDAKMALIDAAIGEGDGNLGGRVSTLESDVATIKGGTTTEGSIAKAVADEAAIARAAEKANADAITVINGSGAGSIAKAVADEAAIARAAEKANADAIAVLNGNTTGSVAFAVAGEAALREAADSALDGRVTTVEGNVQTLMGGTATEGSVAKALADAKAYTAEREAVLQGNIDGKVDAVEGKGLSTEDYTTEEKGKLAALPTNADLTSALGAKANAEDVYTKTQTYTQGEVDSAISTAVSAAAARVFKYRGTQDSLEALNALDKNSGINAPVIGDVWHVANAGTNGGDAEYVCTDVNADTGIGTWEELGTAVDLTSYSTTAQMESAISAAVLVEENRAKGIESGLATRLTTAEGDIDALEGRMDTAETAIGTVDSRIATAKGEAITAAGTAADTKIATAIGNLTVNGQTFSGGTAAVITGTEITLGPDFTAVENGYLSGMTANNNIAEAIDALDAALITVTGGTSGEGGSIAALQSQITDNSTSINALNAALPIADFASTTVTAQLATKVDKEQNKSLVADDEITKLAAYPAYSVVSAAIDAKVTAEEGKGLVPTADITKLAALNDQATTDAALAGKVDKNGTDRLMTVDEGTKLAALPTNTQLNTLLAAKADKQPVVAGASETLEAGKRYVVKGEFAGTLPAEPADGATVEFLVLVGGTNRLVSAGGNDSILGQKAACAIGISEEGWQLDNEQYTFVYDADADNWHVL